MRRFALAASLLLVAGAAAAEPFRFIALGDMPYGEPAEVYPPFEALIGAVNARAPSLVVHVGDIKSGGTPCSDEMLTDQLAFMNRFSAPVIYTPGDNEWTDCHRKGAGGFDPLERLAFIKRTFFAAPERSLGAAPVAVESQAASGYPENTRLMHEGVMFVAAHVVGSNNNFEVRSPEAAAEFFARDAASTTWLKESFAAAAGAEAVVLAIHANMFEFDFNEFGKEGWLRHSGFANFGEALQAEAAAFGKPVLLIYGDSHIFRLTRPLRKTAPNVLALEVFGAADMHAVEVEVDLARPGIFGVAPVLNPALGG